MVLPTVFVGNRDHAHGSPVESFLRQYRSSGKTWDDIAVVEDDCVGVAFFVEGKRLLDLCIGGNGFLVVDGGGGASDDDDGMIGLGADFLHLLSC